MYIQIENISRGVDGASNLLLTRTIGHCTIAGGKFGWWDSESVVYFPVGPYTFQQEMGECFISVAAEVTRTVPLKLIVDRSIAFKRNRNIHTTVQ